MAKESENQNTTPDRRDAIHQGSSLSGSTKRNNDATEKALHPEQRDDRMNSVEHRGMSESGVIARDNDEEEVVDQDPGERQKENQNRSKEDPLAA